MSEMFDVSNFLDEVDPEKLRSLVQDLRELMKLWQRLDERTLVDQTLQREANHLVGKIRQDYGLTPEQMDDVIDNEEAFRAHLRHPSRPRT